MGKSFLTRAHYVGLSVSATIFAVTNYINFHRPVTCWDCRFPYGVPFTFWQDGGFAGDRGFVLTGAVANPIVVIAGGIALGWIWTKFFQR